jgi:hypothetical protein
MLLLELARAVTIRLRGGAGTPRRRAARPTEGTPMTPQLNRKAVAHVRFDGRSFDVPLAELSVSDSAGDDDVKHAVARHLEVPEARLRDYLVDRHESGNLTVRPAAVFG